MLKPDPNRIAPYTTEEVAELFHYRKNARSIRGMCERHEIPSAKLGRDWLINAKWVNEQLVQLGILALDGSARA
jgi:hypothetical protein